MTVRAPLLRCCSRDSALPLLPPLPLLPFGVWIAALSRASESHLQPTHTRLPVPLLRSLVRVGQAWVLRPPLSARAAALVSYWDSRVMACVCRGESVTA